MRLNGIMKHGLQAKILKQIELYILNTRGKILGIFISSPNYC